MALIGSIIRPVIGSIIHSIFDVTQPVIKTIFTSATLPTGWTFSRGHLAYSEGEGAFALYDVDAPRFEYDNIRNKSEGIVLNGNARTQYCRYSNDFTTQSGGWSGTAVAVDDQLYNYFGSDLPFSKIKADTTSSTHFTRDTYTSINGRYTTFSVYVVDDGSGYGVLLQTGHSGNYKQALFFPSTGVIAHETGLSGTGFVDADYTENSMRVVDILNDGRRIYRISVRVLNTADDATSESRARIYLHNGTSTSFAGNDTSGVFVAGAQIEQTTFAPHMPSTLLRSSTGTEQNTNADDLRYDMTGIYNSEKGALFFEGSIATPNGATQPLVSLTNADATQQINIRSSATNERITFIVVKGGVTDVDEETIETVFARTMKLAVSWDDSTLVAYIDGIKVLDTTLPNGAPTGITSLQIGRRDTSLFAIEMRCARVYYYDTTLTKSHMRNLTA